MIMGTTSKFQIPYVAGSDFVPDFPEADRLQAEYLENLMTVPTRYMNLHYSGYESDGSVEQGFRIEPDRNWFDIVGTIAFISIVVTYTGIIIQPPEPNYDLGPWPVPADGNCQDCGVGEFYSDDFYVAAPIPMMSTSHGRMSYWSQGGSTLYLQAVEGAPTSIAKGEQFQINGVGQVKFR